MPQDLQSIVAQLMSHPYYTIRSAVFREGARDCLLHQALTKASPRPYCLGTVDRDAYDNGYRIAFSTWDMYCEALQQYASIERALASMHERDDQSNG